MCSTFCEKDYELSAELRDSWCLVGQIEMALSQWAMRFVGFDLESYMERYDSLADDFETVTDKESKGWSEKALSICGANGMEKS